MVINLIPPNQVSSFIYGALDISKPDKGVRVGKQAQISLAMPSGLLAKVDEADYAVELDSRWLNQNMPELSCRKN